jgi:ABC-2 type transport system permease protein
MAALRSYTLLFRWQMLRLKSFLPLMIVVQAIFALGIVVGYPLLFAQLDQTTILYLSTGAPAITLITIGLVAVPQVVSQAKTEGTLEYMRALPIPRLTYLAADLTLWLLIVLPGVILGIVIGAWRFNLHLEISPAIVPGLLLVALTTSSLGYTIASFLPQQVAVLLTQVLVVFVLMFSPLNFPVERLPDWLAAVHAVLPIQAMGEVIRGSVASNNFPLTLGPFLVLVAWCIAGLGLTSFALTRRG